MATSWDDYQIEALGSSHEKKMFSCGEPLLDEFLQKFAKQNEKNDLTRTYVVVEKTAPTVICGFSSVRFGQVAFDHLPDRERKGIARYPVPTFLIARFAVDARWQGKRLCELLLLHALRLANASAARAGLYAVEVVAKTESAAAFYAKYGFVSLVDDKLHMYLSLKTVRKMFKG